MDEGQHREWVASRPVRALRRGAALDSPWAVRRSLLPRTPADEPAARPAP